MEYKVLCFFTAILLVNTLRKLVSAVTNVTMDYLVLQVVANTLSSMEKQAGGQLWDVRQEQKDPLKMFC